MWWNSWPRHNVAHKRLSNHFAGDDACVANVPRASSLLPQLFGDYGTLCVYVAHICGWEAFVQIWHPASVNEKKECLKLFCKIVRICALFSGQRQRRQPKRQTARRTGNGAAAARATWTQRRPPLNWFRLIEFTRQTDKSYFKYECRMLD